jgi:tetratricopeptide (TPR) repeat protein
MTEIANLTAGQRLFTALEIDLNVIPIEQLDEYLQIEYFLLSEDEPPADANRLEKVERYLQVFTSLTEVSAWEKAGQVLSFCLENNEKKLHEQLRIWGYHRDLIELYQKLLNKVSSEQDLICLDGLGESFFYLSDFDKSFDYHQQQVQLAQALNRREEEAKSLGYLGSVKHINQNYAEAIAYFRQQLQISHEINNQKQEGYALSRMGFTLFQQGIGGKKYKYQVREALSCLDLSLNIARHIGDQELEIISLGYISKIYFERGQFDKSLILLQQQLDICEKSSNLEQEIPVMLDLGNCYMELEQYSEALEYLQKTLKISREIGDKWYECYAVNSLSILYGYNLQKYENAIFYAKQQLEISEQIHRKKDISIHILINLFNFYTSLGNKNESDVYLEMAKSIAVESDSIESKAMVIMAIARSYWIREQIWYKLYGLFLALKGLTMVPPWQSTNGRMAFKLVVESVTKSAQNFLMGLFKRLKNFLRL